MVNHPIRCGLISAINSPILGHALLAMEAEGALPDVVILDTDAIPQRDIDIFVSRTGGLFQPKDIDVVADGRLNIAYVDDHNGIDCLTLIRDHDLDFLVSAGLMRILRTDLLHSTPLGVLNCHPGILPEFRGCSCPEWALYLGETPGNSVHVMTEGIDDGPVLQTEVMDPSDYRSFEEFRCAVHTRGIELLARVSGQVARRELDPCNSEPQVGGRYFRPIPHEYMADVQARFSGA